MLKHSTISISQLQSKARPALAQEKYKFNGRALRSCISDLKANKLPKAPILSLHECIRKTELNNNHVSQSEARSAAVFGR